MSGQDRGTRGNRGNDKRKLPPFDHKSRGKRKLENSQQKGFDPLQNGWGRDHKKKQWGEPKGENCAGKKCAGEKEFNREIGRSPVLEGRDACQGGPLQ